MAEKIGFLNFTYFDLPTANDFAVFRHPKKRLEPRLHVKTLAESNPSIPIWRTEAPALNKDLSLPAHKFTSELNPSMQEFDRHVLYLSRNREMTRRFMLRLKQEVVAESLSFRHLDRIQSWFTRLYFARVYYRTTLQLNDAIKFAHQKKAEQIRFMSEHCEQRLEDAKYFPELHTAEINHPFRPEIKAPNQLKPFDLAVQRSAANHALGIATKEQLEKLRQLLQMELAAQFNLLQSQAKLNTQQRQDTQSLDQRHASLKAFNKIWNHSWDQKDIFKNLQRSSIIEQAETFPKMFKKSIKDPFEVEIRIPNQHDWPQDLSLHQAQLLRLLKLRKLHEHCNLQIKEQRVDLAKNTSLLTSTFNHHFQDMQRLGEADYRQSLHFAQNRGYMLLAGRLVPQPIIRVSTDIKTTLPLSLGLHGDPGHLEKVNPCPPQLLPQPEAAVWQKVRQSQEDGGKIYEQAKEIELLQHSQRVRRALAAIDYGEQKQKEPIQAVSHGHLPDADPRLTAESILDLALQKKI